MSTVPIESAFRQIVSLLQKAKTDYLLIGGLAVAASGQPRMTQDIDLILFIEKAGLPLFLEKAGKKFKVNLRSAVYGTKTRGAWATCRNWRIVKIPSCPRDIFSRPSPPVRQSA